MKVLGCAIFLFLSLSAFGSSCSDIESSNRLESLLSLTEQKLELSTLEDNIEMHSFLSYKGLIDRLVRQRCPDNEEVASRINQVFAKVVVKATEGYLSYAQSISSERSPQFEESNAAKLAEQFNLTLDDLSTKSLWQELESSSKNTTQTKSSCTDKVNNQFLTEQNIRDQGDSGWCTTVAAADLISHYLGTEVSALDLRNSFLNNHPLRMGKQIYIDGKTPLTIEGGQIELNLRAGLSKGFCLNDDFPMNLDGGLSAIQVLSDYDSLNSIISSPDALCTYQQSSLFELSNLPLEEIVELMGHTGPRLLLNNLSTASCKTRINSNNLSTRTYSRNIFRGNKSLEDTINNSINSNGVVGIHFYSGFLSSPFSEKSKPHASTIIGRVFDEESQSCQYILRNTHGRRCGNSIFPCQNGHYRVPTDYLLSNIEDVITISTK